MTRSDGVNQHGHSDWVAFAGRHLGNPILASDPLYALSEPLVDAIRRGVPSFFTPDQERFERDLARSASFGYFLRRALGFARAGATAPGGWPADS